MAHSATFRESATFNATFGIISEIGEYAIYKGEYTIIPTSEDQLLATKNKQMRDNLLVKEIPTSQVSNEFGGTTFTIGG